MIGIGYIVGIITFIYLILITITANYTFILTHNQVNELWLGTIFAIIIFGFIRIKLFSLDNFDVNLLIPAALFALWYSLTTITSNIINFDKNSNTIRFN